MNTRFPSRLFALLLSITLIFGGIIAGTTAYVADATPAVSNIFVYDPSIFPAAPTPVPTPQPVPEINLPDTGDHSSLVLWGAMLMLNLSGRLILRRREA